MVPATHLVREEAYVAERHCFHTIMAALSINEATASRLSKTVLMINDSSAGRKTIQYQVKSLMHVQDTILANISSLHHVAKTRCVVNSVLHILLNKMK